MEEVREQIRFFEEHERELLRAAIRFDMPDLAESAKHVKALVDELRAYVKLAERVAPVLR